ncbi:MAG: fructose PTS transporter subunit IIA [Bacillota bacterium]
MRIQDLLSTDLICMNLRASTKDEVIRELAGVLDRAGKLNSLEEYIVAVYEREALGSTGVGMGVAIPHGKSAAVREPAVAFGKSVGGVDFQSIDGTPAHLIFMIAVPASADNQHLRILAILSRMLIHEDFRKGLMEAGSPEDVFLAIQAKEAELAGT